MTHDEIREMLSAGDRTPAIETHLARCKACRSWDETLQSIRRAAPQTYADAPAGLATSVLAAVQTAAVQAAVTGAPAALDTGAPKVVEISLWRRLGVRAAIAAALSAIVAAGVLLPADGDPMVAVAARKTTAAGTARFQLTTSFSLRPAEPIALRRADAARVGASVKSNLPPGLPPSVRRALGRAADGLSDRAPRPIVSISSTASGRGEIVFPDRMRFSATVTENNGVTSQAGKSQTIVVDGKTWLRTELFGEKWVRVPGFGADISFDFHPGSSMTRMSRFEGGAKEIGVETRNGERVRHYRFTDSRDFGVFLGARTVTIDTWVGVDDGRVHEVLEVHSGDGERGHVESREHLRFYDFGARVSVVAPPASRTTTIAKTAASFYGYGFGMAGASFSFDFEAAASMPDFSFPEIRIPEFRIPDIKLPNFELPTLEIPDLELPDFQMPAFPAMPVPRQT